MAKTIEEKTTVLREVAAYIRGKFENSGEDTVGHRKAKQQARYRVKRWAIDMHNRLKGAGRDYT